MKKELLLPEYIKKDDKKTSEVIPFSVLTGGKDGPPKGDWLSDMPEGTIFLVRQKGVKSFDLLECHVLYQLPKSTYLLRRIADQEVAIYVDPPSFCDAMELYEIIKQDELDEPKEEQHSGTVQSGAVEVP